MKDALSQAAILENACHYWLNNFLGNLKEYQDENSVWNLAFSHFPLCTQSFPASGSFPMRQLYTSGGQSFGTSASASLLAMHIQSSIPLGLTGLTSLQSKGLSESLPEPQFKTINSLVLSLLYGPIFTLIYDCWKNHSSDYVHLCWQSDVSALS